MKNCQIMLVFIEMFYIAVLFLYTSFPQSFIQDQMLHVRRKKSCELFLLGCGFYEHDSHCREMLMTEFSIILL